MIINFTLCLLMIGTSSASINIAIIGGGIGGSSSAYFLHKMNPSISVTVYEADKIGGRLSTIEFEGNSYENGGSIIHDKNLYMSSFVEELGLERNPKCGETYGIFDSYSIFFTSSSYDIITLYKFLRRYGLDIFRLDGYIKELLYLFSSVYEMSQYSDYPFNTTTDLLANIHGCLLRYLNGSMAEGFERIEISDEFTKEVVAAAINCNYCQSTRVHQFVGSVALAGAGAALWSVKGGNKKVAEHLILRSAARVIYERVESISPFNQSEQYLVSTARTSGLYDYVIIATPLINTTKIKFHGFNEPVVWEHFHHTFSTLVEGEINYKYFDSDKDSFPDVILCNNENEFFNAMSKVNPVSGDCINNNIWRIFSNHQLTEKEFNLVFHEYYVVSVTDWLAYPEYGSKAEDKSFFLFKNITQILYINAIEALASAMEMSVIGAHNVVHLIKKYLPSYIIKSIFQ